MITFQEAKNKYPPNNQAGILLSADEFKAIKQDIYTKAVKDAANILVKHCQTIDNGAHFWSNISELKAYDEILTLKLKEQNVMECLKHGCSLLSNGMSDLFCPMCQAEKAAQELWDKWFESCGEQTDIMNKDYESLKRLIKQSIQSYTQELRRDSDRLDYLENFHYSSAPEDESFYFVDKSKAITVREAIDEAIRQKELR